MRITRRQIRQIIKEATDVMNAETGEVLVFADTDEYGAPTAPEAALRDVMKRLGLTNPDGSIKAAKSSPGYQADMDVQTIDLNAEDWQDVYQEIEGKRYYRKNKAERERLDFDKLMDRLEAWSIQVGKDYMADNREFPDTNLEDVAWDMSDAAEMEFKEDEWNVLLEPFDYNPEDLRTHIADMIAGAEER